MGLDITAYSGLAPAPEAELDEHGCPVEWEIYLLPGVAPRQERDYPGRAEGLLLDVVYSWEQCFGFSCDSYSTYKDWRDVLAEMAGYGSAEAVWNDPKPGPFVELIDFSGENGIIGPIVSAKLSRDFADYAERAKKYAQSQGEYGTYWLARYEDWKEAFELASDRGLVEFH